MKTNSLKLDLPMAGRIRALRFASQIRQGDLAALIDCSQGSISKLENGVLEPTLHQLIRLRSVFDVSVDSILDDCLDYVTIARRFRNSKFTLESLHDLLVKRGYIEQTMKST